MILPGCSFLVAGAMLASISTRFELIANYVITRIGSFPPHYGSQIPQSELPHRLRNGYFLGNGLQSFFITYPRKIRNPIEGYVSRRVRKERQDIPEESFQEVDSYVDQYGNRVKVSRSRSRIRFNTRVSGTRWVPTMIRRVTPKRTIIRVKHSIPKPPPIPDIYGGSPKRIRTQYLGHVFRGKFPRVPTRVVRTGMRTAKNGKSTKLIKREINE
ncbi:hypothetical protein K7432_004194 [Basidiobolus ranarum]|uniref:Uncharacterized protein n=1 Tax=Basidiobolus ranarum TaxID=34480 RepID=A0ABR2W4Z4_9FUNG